MVRRVEWVNDKRVNKTMHFHVPITIEGTKAWFAKNQNNHFRCDMAFVHLGVLCAMGGFTDITTSPEKSGELYIFVNPKLHHQGLGKESTSLLCEYGFYHLHFKSIYLYTNGDNYPAQAVYNQLGFRIEEIQPDATTNGSGKVVDRLKYRLQLRDFKPYDEKFFKLDDALINGRAIKIVRDDLFPAIVGGSKARKAAEYERQFKDSGINAMVTTGGIQSNHNRAIAIMATRNGWRCHLVYHGSQERFEQESGNARIVKSTTATTEFVEIDQISKSMDSAMDNFRALGLNPYYIHGGGHDISGGIAYVKAVQSLFRHCEKIGYKPDAIIHASGTGSTQAGIITGLELIGWNDVKVIGISVARNTERGSKIIKEFLKKLADYYNIDKDLSSRVFLDDRFISGGYEKTDCQEKNYLQQEIKNTGIIFDSTYSGKALWGLKHYIDEEEKGCQFLFWHTGGIMNYLE